MDELPGWDDDLFPEPVAHPTGPVVKGEIVMLRPGYPRELRVGQPVLIAILLTASLSKLVAMLIATLRGTGGAGGARRRWRELRKGPEFLVTPLRLRDGDGVLCEVEIHGYLSRTALQRGDLVRLRIRPQRDRELPPRAERIANLTTGQVLAPAPPTLWSHLGPALVLQAVLGTLLLASLVLCAVAVSPARSP